MALPAVSQRGLTALLYPDFFVLCLIFGVLCSACYFLFPKFWKQANSEATMPMRQLGAFCLFAFLYLGIAFYVLSFPGYVDPVEPMVVSASYFAVHGRPVYDMLISYGPFCFLFYGAAMKLFGATVVTLKSVVAIGNLAFVTLLLVLYRKVLSWRAALLAVAMVLAACLMKLDYLLQARGDLFIYVSVALGLLSALLAGAGLAVVSLAIALAVAFGVKVTAVLYLIYPMVIFWRRHGVKLLTLSCIAAAVLSILPFALRTLVLADYVHWLVAMSTQPRSSREFVGNLVSTFFLAAPCLVAYWQLRVRSAEAARRYLRSEWLPLLSLVLSVAVMDVLASKIGAGRHHLLPFFPVVGLVTAQLIRASATVVSVDESPRLIPVYLWGCLVLLLLVTELSEFSDVRALTKLEAPEVITLEDEVQGVLTAFPGRTVELGDGFGEFDLEKTYQSMYAAPQLVFAGNPYTFDPSAEADLNMMNKPTRASDLQHVSSCQTDVWLIPRGDKPFHSISIYSGMYPDRYNGRLLFSPEFEQAFKNTYVHSSSGHYFDVYTCRKK